jgi:hypothetical protein
MDYRWGQRPARAALLHRRRRDPDAVVAGFTLPYNSGAVEGHVNCIIPWTQIVRFVRVSWRRTAAMGSSPAVTGVVSWRRVGPAGWRVGELAQDHLEGDHRQRLSLLLPSG